MIILKTSRGIDAFVFTLCLHCVHPVRNVLGKEILECNTTPNNFEVSDNITICSYRRYVGGREGGQK